MASSQPYLALPGKQDRYTDSPRQPTRLHRFAVAAAVLLGTGITLFLLLLLSLLGLKFNNTDKNYGCDPLGNVWVTQAHRPDLWGNAYGLSITLGFGQFEFSQAKAIDVAWDLVVGRGCQIIGIVLVYYAFRGPVVASMSRSTVPYEKIVQLEYNSAGVTAFFTYAKDVHWKKRTGYQFFAGLMLAISCFYVVLTPTWISAMSGYQPIDMPFLRTKNNTYVGFSELDRCSYIIQDGPRVGLDEYACIARDSKAEDVVAKYFNDFITYKYQDGWSANSLFADRSSQITLPHTPTYALQSPVLNITQNDFSNMNHAVFYNGRSLSAYYLADNSICEPQKLFRWGFSLILLFMFLSITWLLSIIVYVVWVIDYWTSYRHAAEERKLFGSLRTTLAVAGSILEELGPEEANDLSNEELKKALKARGAGMRLRGRQRRTLTLTREERGDRQDGEDIRLRLASWNSRRASSMTRIDFRYDERRSVSRTSFL